MSTYRAIFIILCVGLLSYATELIPYKDEAQTVLTMCIASFLLWQLVSLRKNEEECDRYARICDELFPVRKKEDAYHTSNLLGGSNLPWQWVSDLNAFFAKKFDDQDFNLAKLAGLWIHLADSFSVFGDKPGSNLTKATLWFSEFLRDTSKTLAEHLEHWAKNNRKILGEEVAENCFYKEMKKGDNQPYGLFMCSPLADLLATTYEIERAVLSFSWFGKPVRKIKTIKCARICVKNAGDNDAVVKAVHEIFPEFTPGVKYQGSGKQDKGLFVQETVPICPDEFESRLPQLIEKLFPKNS